MGLDAQIIEKQLQSLIHQRDQSAQTHQQCVGAISILQEQLKFISDAECAEIQESKEDAICDEPTNGEIDGETECEEPIEAANV